MNKSIILVLISIIILGTSAVLFFQANKMRLQAQSIEQQVQHNQSSQDTTQLLKELSAIMRKPGATVDDINNFFVQKFGPCWGIPGNQCRE